MYKNNRKICFGVIIGTRAYFNSELARDVRKQLLKTMIVTANATLAELGIDPIEA